MWSLPRAPVTGSESRHVTQSVSSPGPGSSLRHQISIQHVLAPATTSQACPGENNINRKNIWLIMEYLLSSLWLFSPVSRLSPAASEWRLSDFLCSPGFLYTQATCFLLDSLAWRRRRARTGSSGVLGESIDWQLMLVLDGRMGHGCRWTDTVGGGRGGIIHQPGSGGLWVKSSHL